MALTAEPFQKQSPDMKLPKAPDSASTEPLILAGQQRQWFLSQLEPGGSTRHCASCTRLIGPLDFTALQQSVSEIVRRHEVLRMVFL